jgi:cobalt/nickel transport system permease protein
MHHDFLDKFKHLKSPWSRISAIVRFLISLAIVIFIAILPLADWRPLIVYVLIEIIILLLSKLPLRYFILRSLLVSVPALIIALSASLFKNPEWFFFISFKSFLSVGIMVILISTTSFPSLISVLRSLKMPGLFISLLGFMYRYSFLLIDEFESFQRTYKIRAVGNNKKIKKTALSNITAVLFSRSLLRSDNIYNAMLLRGFNGTFPFIKKSEHAVFEYIILIFVIIILTGARFV